MANLELARAKTVETVDEDVRRALQTHDGELGKSEIVGREVRKARTHAIRFSCLHQELSRAIG